jgi:hypothetical protein
LPHVMNRPIIPGRNQLSFVHLFLTYFGYFSFQC